MTQPKTYTAFFYGTLLHPSILRRVIGHHGADLEICPGLLLEHTRHKVKHADYPGVIPYEKTRQLLCITDSSKDLPAEDRTVRGSLVRGLSEADMKFLDTFEGDEYVRVEVSVHPLAPFTPLSSSASDASLVPSTPPPVDAALLAALPSTHPALTANTYVWISYLDELRPDIWDFAEFVRENAWKWVGSSDAARDNEYYTEVDKRRDMDGHIVRREIVSVGGTAEDGDTEKRVVVEID